MSTEKVLLDFAGSPEVLIGIYSDVLRGGNRYIFVILFMALAEQRLKPTLEVLVFELELGELALVKLQFLLNFDGIRDSLSQLELV